MSGDLTPYLALVPSENADQPKFTALLSAVLQPVVDGQDTLASMPSLYDLDVAIGTQLDTLGLWIGRTRYLTTPLIGVYFSLGIAGLGIGQGIWRGPFDPLTGLTTLSDDAYRILLKAVVVSNQWDGTIPGAYDAWNTLFAGTGYGILIQDNGDMSMVFALTGPSPDAVTLALFQTGELALKPSGVRASYVTQSIPNTPYFGLGVENDSISGLGVGAWATASPYQATGSLGSFILGISLLG